jgi:aminocarboxymuconate-semialdehyde decarboxylase
MPIDVHAHYVPPSVLDGLASRASDFGISVIDHPPTCSCALHFDYGPRLRPFFPKLIEPLDKRLAAMAQQGVDRQVLSTWTDISAYGMPKQRAIAWHAYLNDHLARVCELQPERFSMLASVPLPYPEEAAAELERAVTKRGAVGAVIAANIEGTNLGEVDLDAFWSKAVELDVGVFIHPVQPQPQPRSAKFALTPIVQYTVDTTFTVGSLIFSGVLDRFPRLRLLLSHGGGTLPYLAGRFDLMHERMDRQHQGDVAKEAPSSYLKRFYYDTILHDPAILKWLAERISSRQIVLGSDYSFPPADHDPVGTVRRAGFSEEEMAGILEDNPRGLFPLLA